MLIVIGIIGALFYSTDTMQEYRAHSNGSSEYEAVKAVECETGLHKSGYSVAVVGVVKFKQRNLDGTVGSVCVD